MSQDQDQGDALPDDKGGDVTADFDELGIGSEPGELKDIELRIKELVESAALTTAAQYKQMGKEPPREFTKSFSGQSSDLDLPSRLKNAYITFTNKDDYTFRKPNKRYQNYGHYLPTQFSKKSDMIVIAIDNSGSIHPKQLEQFGAAVTSLMTEMNIHELEILHCDTQINLHEHVEGADLPYKITSRAGGGTAFDPVFREIEKRGWSPDIMMYFTDLEGQCSYGAYKEYEEHWQHDAEGRWTANSSSKRYDVDYPVIWVYSPGDHGPRIPTQDWPMSRKEFVELLEHEGRKYNPNPGHIYDVQYMYRARHGNPAHLVRYLPHIGTFLTLDPDEGQLKT
jgi:hypothetical protein